jgi:hypothetical protein
MKYEVRVVHRAVTTYFVDADTPEQAEKVGRDNWQESVPGEATGSEWAVIESVSTEPLNITPDE